MLVVLVSLLWWQARYTLAFGNPMYGWPMPFNNVWYDDFYGEWRPSILVFDAAVWLVLAGSTGYVINVWRRKANKRQVTLRGLFAVQSVAAVMLALGCIEGYLRAHPNNGSIVPKYAQWHTCAGNLWFDIGLFTDSLRSWLLLRVTVLFAVACSIYTVEHLLCAALVRIRSWMGRQSNGCPLARTDDSAAQDVVGSDCRPANEPCEPLLVRVFIYVLLIVLMILALATLFPPMVRT